MIKLKSHLAANLYQPINWLTVVLLPLSFMFYCIVNIRRALYRFKILKTTHFNVPIVVIGNITVGGTGKTPIVMWLANTLMEKGYKVGIVSRGYAALNNIKTPITVTSQSDVNQVGDEAYLMALHCPCPIMIGSDRVAVVQQLLKDFSVDVIISDDGLQHYALGRNVEIIVVDEKRKFGNGLYLPAGPLRESISRLALSDLTLYHNTKSLHYVSGPLTAVSDFHQTKKLGGLKNLTVHAVAGIGNPDRFFEMLRDAQMNIVEHVYDDHHHFQRSDINFNDDNFVIMTEKDAVKCRGFADGRHWFLPVELYLDDLIQKNILQLCDFNKE